MAVRLAAIALALFVSGCIVTRPLRTSGAANEVEVYTRDQVDFLLLQAHCKANARTLVQVARCDVVR